MGCTSCTSSKGEVPKGCKNNGTCGTDGCNKLTVFDWLANMTLPENQLPFPYAEVRFKNGRKEFYVVQKTSNFSVGDVVATEVTSGYDIGIISLTGELVRIQMKKKQKEIEPNELKIIRKATQRDIDTWHKVKEKEEQVKVKARQIAIRLNLRMKISDVEYQGDGTKAIFYYTAEERVDFRDLIKEFAHEFTTRIEMKQVGFRQEASRLGGIGSCGRELCCSTWLTDFRSVNTSAARYQQLSLNPQKLAGQCGKLKCCLNYELDSYMEALVNFPSFETKLVTEKGIAICQKLDIFKGVLWYCYEGEWMNWYQLSAEKANEIIKLNKQNKKVGAIEDYIEEVILPSEEQFNNVVGQDSLTRFDKHNEKKRKGRNKNRKKRNPQKNDK